MLEDGGTLGLDKLLGVCVSLIVAVAVIDIDTVDEAVEDGAPVEDEEGDGV